VTVGVDPAHATGRALRRAAHAKVHSGHEVVPVAAWIADRHARHWWHSLTRRLRVPARMRVTEVADGVFHAQARDTAGPMGWAVEATAGAAAAFAALAATGVAQARAAGVRAHRVAMPGGALAVLAAGTAPVPPSEPAGSPVAWLATVAAREPALVARLRRLVGEPVAGPAGPPGFTVLTMGGPG
jgi:hypothetical protein